MKYMIYYLILKSHSEAPDIEQEIEADSKEEAVEYFYKWLGSKGWDKNIIEENTYSDEDLIK